MLILRRVRIIGQKRRGGVGARGQNQRQANEQRDKMSGTFDHTRRLKKPWLAVNVRAEALLRQPNYIVFSNFKISIWFSYNQRFAFGKKG